MRAETLPTATTRREAQAPLSVLLVLETSEGGLRVLPHVDELRRRGHTVTVVLPRTPGRLRTALEARGILILDSPFDFRFRPVPGTLAGLVRLRRMIVRFGPDVLHYHLYASALAVRLSSLGLAVPRVHMVAGPKYLESASIRVVERLLARLDTVTICGSDYTSRQYRELGRPVRQTPTIPYGVDTRRYQPFSCERREEVRARLGIAPDTFVGVMVAHVHVPKWSLHDGHGAKGHEVLLAAWRVFHAEHPASHLLLVGGGYDEAGERHRQALIRLFRLADPIGETGVSWVETTEDVRPYYAAADVFVSPSFSGSHGAVVEASAMGLPSIVSDAGALPEAVPPECGWVVPVGDIEALTRALHRAHTEHLAGRLAKFGWAARELALGTYSAVKAADAVATVIEGAAVRPARAGRQLTLFTEARFARRDGRWVPVDPVNRGPAPAGYLNGGRRMRIVARAGSRPGRHPVLLDDGNELLPLPSYIGVRGFLHASFALTVAVTKAVADAEAIVLRLPGTVATVAALACRVLRRRYAAEVVGDPEEALRAGVVGRSGRLAARSASWLQRWVVRGASAVRYVTGETLQRRYPPAPGTRADAIADVRLDRDALVPRAREWQPGPFRVVAVQSHETRRGGDDVLLAAFQIVTATGVPVIATVMGHGRSHGELLRRCEEAGLADTVSFTGTIEEPAELVEILDTASLFVLPFHAEGVPRTLVEAMARALPAVGSALGAIPELLDESCVVPPDDPVALAGAIRRLLSDPAAWEEQSRRNLAVARTFERSELDPRLAVWLRRVPSARKR